MAAADASVRQPNDIINILFVLFGIFLLPT